MSNYPNLFPKENIFFITLKEKSNVTVELFDKTEIKCLTILEKQELLQGKQNIRFNGNRLNPGIYTAKTIIENSEGISLEYSKIKIN